MADQPSLFDQHQKNFDLPDDIQVVEPILINKDLEDGNMIDILPKNAVLAVTNSYPLQAMYISRILNLLSDNYKKGETITRAEISKLLAMSSASAKGTTNMLRKAYLIDAKTNITQFGLLVVNSSPFIDDIGLLWLLHYIMASNARLAVWSTIFNLSFQEKKEITIQEIITFLNAFIGTWSENSIKTYGPHEVGAILRTYSDYLFSTLNIIQRDEKGEYSIYNTKGLIPNMIFLSIILIYRDRYYPGATTMEIPLLVNAHYSPGRILMQNEAIVRKALEGLHNEDLLSIETRSGLDQIRFKRDINWFSALKAYFGGL